MANLDFIKNTLNPSAVPAHSDLIPISKADGSPAAYTLQELANYINGVVAPTWYTTAAISGKLEHSYYESGKTQVGNTIIPLDVAVNDTGFFTSLGTFTIFDNITKVQMGFGFQTNTGGLKFHIIKNGDVNNKVATTTSNTLYYNLMTPDIPCVSGDYFQVYIEGSGTIIYTNQNTYFWIRATEKIQP